MVPFMELLENGWFKMIGQIDHGTGWGETGFTWSTGFFLI